MGSGGLILKVIAIIPARMGSSRFPGKPLALINGTPMIEVVYRAASKCQSLNKCVVATCDLEIYDHITGLGGDSVMTSEHHERASDRCAEALIKIEKEVGYRFDVIVMVQGDEPMVTESMINDALAPFYEANPPAVVNLLAPLQGEADFQNPSVIKVVCDDFGNALYMSRQPIPTGGNKSIGNIVGKQLCIIPFSREALLTFERLDEACLEKMESIDMLRFIQHRISVRMIATDEISHAVDTPADLAVVEKMMRVLDTNG